MTYAEWEAGVHERVKTEPVWEFLGYRKALFLYALAWKDCEGLTRDRRGRAVAEQLIRALLVSELNRQRSRRHTHRRFADSPTR